MLRSYDPQIGRFLQNDPYDQFASGYVGMGNDPGNLTDEDGGCAGCKISATASKQVAGVGYNSVVTFKRVTSTTISFSKVMAESNNALNVVNAVSDATNILKKPAPEKTFKPTAEIRAYEPGPLENWSKSENVLLKVPYEISDDIYVLYQVFFSVSKGNEQHLGGGHVTGKEKLETGGRIPGMVMPIPSFKAIKYANEVAKTSTKVVEQAAVHGNSLKSLKPTWGYKLYSQDGTFLKNGITSKLTPESRYTKSFMSDKFMEKFPFSNRLDAWKWEFQQNQILRGPLNKNMH